MCQGRGEESVATGREAAEIEGKEGSRVDDWFNNTPPAKDSSVSDPPP